MRLRPRVDDVAGLLQAPAGFAQHEVSNAACTPPSAIARFLESYGESAWVQISDSEATSQLSVLLCYRNRAGHLSQSLLQIASGDVGRGALASVEALNGLRAEPTLTPAAACAPVKVETAPATPSLQNAFMAGAAIVFDPLGIGPIVGVTGGLEAGLTRRLSLHLDAFAPVRARHLERTDRTLEVDVAWLRAGASLGWPLWITDVQASLSAGPALVWAESHAHAPLIGTARRSGAFVISAGGALELPRDSSWFLRGYYQVGTILPRINVVTSLTDTEHLGPLLFQLGATLGTRWSG